MHVVTAPEEWRPIAGYEGYYEVSNLGNVRSIDREVEQRHPSGRLVTRRLQGAPMKQFLHPRFGYMYVHLQRDGVSVNRRVHRLVLEAFIGPCPEGMEVCHNNATRNDNRLVNLRYGTSAENKADMLKHGTNERRNRTHCPQDHPLITPNLAPWELSKGKRKCYACSLARGDLRKSPDADFKTLADQRYDIIITSERIAA